MDLGISGRWALVCGASRGLGLGCARALVAEGVNVVIVARGETALQAASEELLCDALLVDQISRSDTYPYVDVREDDVSMAHEATVSKVSDDQLFYLMQRGLGEDEAMAMIVRGFGRIVNITSSSVKAPIDTLALSNGARSGLTGFVAGLARRTVGHNVTINNLLPGQFDTDRLRANFAHAAGQDGDVQAVADRRRQQIPAGRFGTPDEFGAACAFLCSAQAGYLTGQNLLIDGGAYPGTF